MPARRDDRGVTLLEVLIAVVLLAIIMVPLTNALIAFMRNTDATNDRLAASHDAQIAAAYFAQDVQSIGLHDWTTAPYAFKTSVEQNAVAQSGNRCGPSTTPNAVIRMAWDDPTVAVTSGTPPMAVVSYVVVPDGGERQLHRLRCDASGTVLQDIIVAHNLVADPVATCRNAAGATQACAGPPVPQSIEMPLQLRVSGSANSILTVTLVGQRRQT
jgi:prepilin-type N-terminal cleavage/methylation domain-containing protein